MRFIPFIAFLFTISFFQSCSNNESNNAEADQTSNTGPSIDPNGPEVEINVLNFDLEKNETTIEIINRKDESITSIGGRLSFYDEAGALLTTATGRDMSSPFQMAQNPQVVGTMASVEKVLKNAIPEGTSSIQVEEITGKTASGSF